MVSTRALDDGAISLVLGLSDSADTRALWPHRFDLTIEIRIGTELQLGLVTHNPGSEPFTITQALHTYLRVGAMSGVKVSGLEGRDYLDKASHGERLTQSGAISVEQEVDRIYIGVGPEQLVEDAALGRRVRITTTGSRTAVIWNPWVEIAKQMGDLEDDDGCFSL